MPHILVVDDDAVVRDHARLCLSGDGHVVETATNGEEGLRLASAHAYELILTDVYMPVLDGFGLASRLREREGEATPAIIFMSNIEDNSNYRRAFGLRAADFLVKPVSCEDLRLAVRDRLNPPARASLPPPARIPGLRVVRPLGTGASARVFLAVREATREQCALKLIHLPEAGDEQREVIERFVTECTILESIDEPGVARVYEHGVTDDCLYIALEYLPGGDLSRELGTPLPAERAIDECLQVARALGCIHARGIVHRDLKPANLMRRADGSLALVDFGIAHVGQVHLTEHGRLLGTPSFMSPEQLNSQRADARSDVYSLGCLFYQMLTGERAFRGESLPALFAAHTAGPRPQLPAALAAIQPVLDRMLARDRTDRFADGRSLASALESVREDYLRRRQRNSTLSNIDLKL
jgi:serine/threonine protein kinase